ncbi:hypothetical protein L9F63_006240, partial [Diploptera punctata]
VIMLPHAYNVKNKTLFFLETICTLLNMVKRKRHNDIVRYATWNVRSIHEKEEELD